MKNDKTLTYSYRLRRKLASLLFRPTQMGFRPAPILQSRHLRNAQLKATRLDVLDQIPSGGVVVEVGVQRGNFSFELMDRLTPQKLHVIDFAPHWIAHVSKRYAREITLGKMEVHHGDSVEVLSSFPDEYFDLIYLDANHTYSFIHDELEISRKKIKPGGLIMCNDYIFYDHILGLKYGVVEAVNEFCITYDWEIVYFAFEPQMFNDVCLRKITES